MSSCFFGGSLKLSSYGFILAYPFFETAYFFSSLVILLLGVMALLSGLFLSWRRVQSIGGVATWRHFVQI